MILQEMPTGADFLAIELNPRFADEVAQQCPAVSVYNDSATRTRKYLEEHGHTQCDSIVCGLPWASFPHELQDRLLDVILDVLRPGGRFATFAYLQGLLLPAGKAFREKLRSRFRRVEQTRTVWMNLPPAFIYSAEK
jgi:phospholipid N-methyltransferase